MFPSLRGREFETIRILATNVSAKLCVFFVVKQISGNFSPNKTFVYF